MMQDAADVPAPEPGASDRDDLRRRLERLGLQLGASGLRAAPPAPAPPLPPASKRDRIEDWVSGREIETAAGPCFVSECRYPLEHQHGALPLGELLEHTPDALRVLTGDVGAGSLGFAELAFLDTETTGLAGGTGTYAFLVGLGLFEGDSFVVRQVFMRDIPEEPALLHRVCEDLAPRRGLVTFNGRAFDWPLLETRLAMNRRPALAQGQIHLDLLLPARRLWRQRLASCALSSLEAQVLGVQRAIDDVPGWAIPGLYRDWLLWGRAEPMRRVFYHNAHDILSLATLAATFCRLLAEPLRMLQHGEDLYCLGQRLESLGDGEAASALYQRCLCFPLSEGLRRATMHRLSHLHRRAGHVDEAAALWRALAERDDVDACLALAKHYEHRTRDLDNAVALAERARDLLRRAQCPDRRRLAEVEHRLCRLRRKRSR
ncbi:MAG: ribonuclease H-like domain-containing protein [Anaerolineae bacterium]